MLKLRRAGERVVIQYPTRAASFKRLLGSRSEIAALFIPFEHTIAAGLSVYPDQAASTQTDRTRPGDSGLILG